MSYDTGKSELKCRAQSSAGSQLLAMRAKPLGMLVDVHHDRLRGLLADVSTRGRIEVCLPGSAQTLLSSG